MNALNAAGFLFIVTLLSIDAALLLNWIFLTILLKAMEKVRVFQK